MYIFLMTTTSHIGLYNPSGKLYWKQLSLEFLAPCTQAGNDLPPLSLPHSLTVESLPTEAILSTKKKVHLCTDRTSTDAHIQVMFLGANFNGEKPAPVDTLRVSSVLPHKLLLLPPIPQLQRWVGCEGVRVRYVGN